MKANVSLMRPVYLDSQATERPFVETTAAMLPFFSNAFGNPSATGHERGKTARRFVETSREQVANALNAPFEGTYFLSGATEANNLVVKSAEFASNAKVVASAIEHKSVLEPLSQLSRYGVTTAQCSVTEGGLVDLNQLESLLQSRVSLVSVMLANNEIGTIQPIKEVRELCRRAGALLHVDAAQAIGKVPFNFDELDADFVTISGHKYGGPQGIGILVVKPEHIPFLKPMMIGGGQEGGMRAGTTPVALCVGAAVGLEQCVSQQSEYYDRARHLRSMLLSGLEKLPGFFLNGVLEERLPGNFSGGFRNISAQQMMKLMPEIQFSTGSACTTGTAENHVLNALGLERDLVRCSFRLSIGWSTSKDEIERAILRFTEVVHQLAPVNAPAL